MPTENIVKAEAKEFFNSAETVQFVVDWHRLLHQGENTEALAVYRKIRETEGFNEEGQHLEYLVRLRRGHKRIRHEL